MSGRPRLPDFATKAMQEEKSQFEEIAGLLRALSKLGTQYDIFRFMKNVTERYGMRAFLIARLPEATTQSLQSVSIISSCPPEFVTRYDQASMMSGSPVFGCLRHTTVPFTLDLEEQGDEPDGRRQEALALFKAYNMERLAMFPVMDTDGRRGAVCLFGERPVPTQREMLELTMLSIHVFDRLYQIGRRDPRPGGDLTEREIDCLNWTAAGKTSAEISEILGLSEHTVNHYLNRATRKLDTVNRTQAVAKALRTGIIN